MGNRLKLVKIVVNEQVYQVNKETANKLITMGKEAMLAAGADYGIAAVEKKDIYDMKKDVYMSKKAMDEVIVGLKKKGFKVYSVVREGV